MELMSETAAGEPSLKGATLSQVLFLKYHLF